MLADVMEALIGASYIEGGMSKALECVRLLHPQKNMQWRDLESIRQKLLLNQEAPGSYMDLPEMFEPVERLLGYTFAHKTLLVQALTHASHTAGGAAMERLEFLGDALLDSIVVDEMWPHDLSEVHMHHLRTASVNSDMQGLRTMELQVAQKSTALQPPQEEEETREGRLPPHVVKTETMVPLWKFMRHSAPQIIESQQITEQRHLQQRDAVNTAIHPGKEYPWSLLAQLGIPKIFGDAFESLIGAIWIDSGSMEACKAVVERAGILPLLRRLIADNVDVLHPKNKLGEMAGKEKVKYKVALVEDGSYECAVYVGEEFLIKVEGGIDKDEVKTKAADAAWRALKAKKGVVANGGGDDDEIEVHESKDGCV
jgi:dsRNA-specific ribonuclease